MANTVTPAPVPLFTVERNNVVKTMLALPFKRGDKAKSGETYPGFPITPETFEEDKKFLGEELFSILNSKVQTIFQGLYEEACDDKGENFDQALFTKYVIEWSARGEKISVLIEQLKAAVAELNEAFDSEDMETAKVLSQRMKRIKDALNNKRRKSAEEKAAADAAVAAPVG